MPHQEEVLVRNKSGSTDAMHIGWLLIASSLVWLIPILLLGVTLGDYDRQITKYAETHQGQLPPPVERANLYASTLSYLRGPGVTAEVLAVLPLVVVAVSVYYLFGATHGSNTSIFRTGALVSALGALAFWLFWTYLGLGLMLGDPAHLPPFVSDPVLNARPNGSPILFMAGLFAVLTVIAVALSLCRSKLLPRTGLIVGVLGMVMLVAIVITRFSVIPFVPHVLLLPLGIGLVRRGMPEGGGAAAMQAGRAG